MHDMGLAAIYPGPNLSKRAQAAAVAPYLLRGVTARRPNHVWGVEIVWSQMTKADVLAAGAGRDDIADLGDPTPTPR